MTDFWTPPWSCAIVLVLASCTPTVSPVAPVSPLRAPPSCPKPPRPAAEQVELARRTSDRLRIDLFDCSSTHEEKRSESLRHWASGGPEGAAWNVEGAPLACRLHVHAPCSGRVAMRVSGNEMLLLEQEPSVGAGNSALEFDLPGDAWKRALEHVLLSPPGPYDVLLLSVSGFLTCSTEEGSTHYPFADAFLAGFSSGE